LDEFLKDMNSWVESVKPIGKVLESAYIKKKFKFENLTLDKEYQNNGLKASNYHGTALCGSLGLGVFTFDATD
jgi:hypothetical protein